MTEEKIGCDDATGLKPVKDWKYSFTPSKFTYLGSPVLLVAMDSHNYLSGGEESMRNLIMESSDFLNTNFRGPSITNLQYVIPVVTKADAVLAIECGYVKEGSYDLPAFLKKAQAGEIPNLEIVLEGLMSKLIPVELKDVIKPFSTDLGEHMPRVMDTIVHSRYNIPLGDSNIQSAVSEALENIAYWHSTGEVPLVNDKGVVNVLATSSRPKSGKKRLIYTVFQSDSISGFDFGGQERFHIMHKGVLKGSSIIFALFDGYEAYSGNTNPNILINGLASYLGATLAEDKNIKNLKAIIPIATKIDLALAVEMGYSMEQNHIFKENGVDVKKVKVVPNLPKLLDDIKQNLGKSESEKLQYWQDLECIVNTKIMPKIVPIELRDVFPPFNIDTGSGIEKYTPMIMKTFPSSIYDIQLKTMNLKTVALHAIGTIMKMDSIGELVLENLDNMGRPKVSVASHKGSVGKTQLCYILSNNPTKDEGMTIGVKPVEFSRGFFEEHSL